MNALLTELREGLDVKITDVELLAIYEEVAMASGGGSDSSNMAGSALSSSDGGVLKPLGSLVMSRRKAVEKTKKIVKLRGKIMEALGRSWGMKRDWTYDGKRRRAVRLDTLEHSRKYQTHKRPAVRRVKQRKLEHIKKSRTNRMRRALHKSRRRLYSR